MTGHQTWHIDDFSGCCEQSLSLDQYPLAEVVRANVLCYSGDVFRQAAVDADKRQALLQELAHVLQYGSGVVLITEAYADSSLLDRHNARFEQLLQQESDQQAGDHFAEAGSNGRIWNALQKVALLDPKAFMDYYKNPVLQLVSEAWLGVNYQVTSQVNIVRPGAKAQQPHRDYHLGFQSPEPLQQYPPHVHQMSAMLTLQGAIAHTDMPLGSGSTQLLPFSQQYPQGYLAWRDAVFIDYFQQHAVQLPLQQGDAIFFNPALFHAAGENRTQNFHRIANLVQISSAFGRAMEVVDRYAISAALYPRLSEQFARMPEVEQGALLSVICEGYSFPTNLDSDPPLVGMAPQTHRQLTEQALRESWSSTVFREALWVHGMRKLT